MTLARIQLMIVYDKRKTPITQRFKAAGRQCQVATKEMVVGGFALLVVTVVTMRGAFSTMVVPITKTSLSVLVAVLSLLCGFGCKQVQKQKQQTQQK